MSEERLKDIQDNINERNMFTNRMYIFREDINDEEQELVNEIERLNNIIEKAVEYVDVITNKGIYESGYGKGTAITICKEHLLDILNGKE